MGKFQETYNLLRLNHEEIEYLNRSIMSKEIKSETKYLSRNKSPGPDYFIGDFCQASKEQLIPILLKCPQRIEEQVKLPNSFYEARITPITNPEKGI